MKKARSNFEHARPSPQSCGGAEGHPANTGAATMTSPRWLISTLLLGILLAAICVYGAICLLFWQGQWQIVFHPSAAITTTPATVGLKYDNIRFGATETGVLQLAGWWIGADPGARYARSTLLFLRDGSGSLSTSVDKLRALHQLGINVFAFDYRGFGASVKMHPSEERIDQDASSAWLYLTGTRHIPPGSIVIDGEGLGAAAAVECALAHPQTAGVILEDLRPATLQLLARNPRLRWLPKRMLFHDRFDPAPGLARLTVAKLFLMPAAASNSGAAPLYYAGTAAPKSMAIITGGEPLYLDKGYLPALNRFLSEHLPAGSQ